MIVVVGMINGQNDDLIVIMEMSEMKMIWLKKYIIFFTTGRPQSLRFLPPQPTPYHSKKLSSSLTYVSRSEHLFVLLHVSSIFLALLTLHRFFTLLIQRLIKLNTRYIQVCLTSTLAFSKTCLKFCVIPSSGPRCFSAKLTAFL